MKITINLNYNKQTLGTIIGRLNAGIKDAKNCCIFDLDSFKTEFETSEEDKKNVLNCVIKVITDEGYDYYFSNNKNNFIRKCPFREKVINVELIPEENNLKLKFGDKIYSFK